MRLQPGRQQNIDWLYELRNGRAYQGYATQAAVAAQYPHVQLFNPAASGKTIIVRLAKVFSTALQNIHQRLYDTALATNQANVQNLLSGGAAAVGQTRSATDVAILGTAFGNFGAVADESRDLFGEWVCVLAAAQGFLVNGATVNTQLSATFQWVEF
mgnify:CR=1 FL=1